MLFKAGSLEKMVASIKNKDHRRSSRFALGDEKFNLDKAQSWVLLAQSSS